MWKLKAEYNKKVKLKNALIIKEEIERLSDYIPEIKSVELGIDFNKSPRAYDIVLYSSFVSKDNLSIYQNHIEHIKVKELINSMTCDVAVVDYEI